MRPRFGSALMVSGAALAAVAPRSPQWRRARRSGAALAAGAALALWLRVPLHPPAWMVTVAIYKGAFAGAAGLLAAGAIVRRRALIGRGRTAGALPKPRRL